MSKLPKQHRQFDQCYWQCLLDLLLVRLVLWGIIGMSCPKAKARTCKGDWLDIDGEVVTDAGSNSSCRTMVALFCILLVTGAKVNGA